jgi:hypothetical protein
MKILYWGQRDTNILTLMLLLSRLPTVDSFIVYIPIPRLYQSVMVTIDELHNYSWIVILVVMQVNKTSYVIFKQYWIMLCSLCKLNFQYGSKFRFFPISITKTLCPDVRRKCWFSILPHRISTIFSSNITIHTILLDMDHGQQIIYQ